MGVSTDVLAKRPKRAVCRARHQAHERPCGTSEVQTPSREEKTTGATGTSMAAMKSGRNSELPKASRSFPSREAAS